MVLSGKFIAKYKYKDKSTIFLFHLGDNDLVFSDCWHVLET